MVTDLNFADLNNDGKKELIIIGEWMPITIFSIDNGKIIHHSPFTPEENSGQAIDHSHGWWNCLEIADLDADGDLDMVVGNLGLNTRFDAPLHLYANDFDNNGSMDPILCVEENGRQLPVPMRDDLIKQLPYLKKKFVRNAIYAKSDIHNVFSKDELNNAKHFTTDILASVWIENKNGEFIIHQLPDAAQIAPVYGIDINDINEDGNLDILLVGNDSGFEVQTGPLDTSPGCLLLGNGSGGFKYFPARNAGFWATDEARDIVRLKQKSSGKDIYLIPNNYNDLLIMSRN
jgi:hypothetical protein